MNSYTLSLSTTTAALTSTGHEINMFDVTELNLDIVSIYISLQLLL